MIIDFHSHILPALDDGAENSKIALAMLKKSRAQGVDTVVSTSHCYPYTSHDVDKFLEDRAAAYTRLMKTAEGEDIPDIIPACELHLTCDLTRLDGIEDLCVGKTNYILIEMPVRKWTDDIIDYVYKLSISGLRPIIVHDERNMEQPKEMLDALHSLDILIQINSGSFGMPVYKKFIDRMMKEKLVHLVGTDMHNLSSRPPDMDKGRKNIIKRYGTDCWDYLMGNAEQILNGGRIHYHDMRAFGKKSLFKRHQ